MDHPSGGGIDGREADIETAAAQLEGAPPDRVLSWAVARHAPRIAFATAFGPEGLVLLHLIATRRLAVDVFTLDTGLFFAETYALWRRLEERYGVAIRAVRPALSLEQQAAREGEALWERDPDRCCRLRKLDPLRQALAGHEAWITAIRRDQTRERAAARVVERDPRHGLIKVSPLLDWSSREVWSYLHAHGVPTSPLHAIGYPSIGCWPCTSPVSADEDPRAGRWRGRTKTECGLHVRPRPLPANSASAERS